MAWRHQRLQSRSLEGRISCDQNCGARTAFAFCELVGIRAEELFWTRLEKLLYTLIEEPDCGESAVVWIDLQRPGGGRDSRETFIVSSTKDANDAILLLHHLLINLRKKVMNLY
jgi:hypothetical protein